MFKSVHTDRISQAIVDQIKDARLLNIEFHRLIAQASENPVIFFTMDSIMDILESNISPMPLSANPVRQTSHTMRKSFRPSR